MGWMRSGRALCAGMIMAGLTAALGGCPGATLATAKENRAALAAYFAAAAVAEVAANLQLIAVGGAARVAADGSIRSPGSGRQVTFGACPVVTLSGEAGVTLSLDLAFPGPCALLGYPDYTCSGSARGVYRPNSQAIEASYHGLQCGGREVTGDVIVEFGLTGDEVTLTGSWELQLSAQGRQVTVDGTVNVNYDRTLRQTQILSYVGLLTLEGETYNLAVTNAFVSYQDNGNLMPLAGQAEASGPDIRTVTVAFSADSPSTGLVTVQVGTAPAAQVNIDDL